jgi:hypothetical protein
MDNFDLRKFLAEGKLHEASPFELDDDTKSNLQHLTKFRGDEKIEKLTGLANYILDTPDFKFVSESLNGEMLDEGILDTIKDKK